MLGVTKQTGRRGGSLYYLRHRRDASPNLGCFILTHVKANGRQVKEEISKASTVCKEVNNVSKVIGFSSSNTQHSRICQVEAMPRLAHKIGQTRLLEWTV